MRLPAVRRRWVALFAAIVLLAVAVRLLDNPSRISYYRVIDDRTLAIGTIEGPGAWTRVTSVIETASTISITVSSVLFQPGPATAVGVPVESIAKLRDPIGGRTVLDGSSGSAVQRANCAPPAYFAPICG